MNDNTPNQKIAYVEVLTQKLLNTAINRDDPNNPNKSEVMIAALLSALGICVAADLKHYIKPINHDAYRAMMIKNLNALIDTAYDDMTSRD